MPVHPCPQPGCSALVASGRCPLHARVAERARGTSTERGYGGVWPRVRASHLAIEPLCRFCAAEGRVVIAREVDHMTPLARGGARLDHANLCSLCKPCHSRKTRSEN